MSEPEYLQVGNERRQVFRDGQRVTHHLTLGEERSIVWLPAVVVYGTRDHGADTIEIEVTSPSALAGLRMRVRAAHLTKESGPWRTRTSNSASRS